MSKFVTLMCLVSSSYGGGGGWNYKSGDAHGPEKWDDVCQSGKHQSPININTQDTQAKSLPPLELLNYDQLPHSSVLVNNGHSAKLATTTSSSLIPTMSGAGLPNKYKFAQVHFHWGSNSGVGSEHTVDNKASAMEMHFVHYKAIHDDIGAALAEGAQDSLAVIGVFLQEGENPNPGFNKLVPYLSSIHHADAKVNVTNFPLSDLITADLSEFYRYEGGLTTPGCFEFVQWTVATKPINITKYQLDAFRNLLDHEEKPLVDNYRPTQPLNDRKVFHATTGSPRWCSTQHPTAAATNLRTTSAFILPIMTAILQKIVSI